jgi:drug/metabolite transporter (DMT)-like permease
LIKKSISSIQAVGFAVLGFTLWVLSDSCAKLAGETVLPPYEILGYFGLFGAGFMLLRARGRCRIRALWPRNPRAQAMRACLAVGSTLCNIVALKHLPLAAFYVTVFLAPMMIAIFAALFLGENMRWPRRAAIVTGFIGVVIAVDPMDIAAQGNTAAGDWIGYAAASFSSVLFAANVTWLRVMAQSESPDSLAFFNALIQGLAGFGVMLVFPAAPVTLGLLGLLCVMGVLGALGGIAVYSALKYTTAATVSQFHYTQIVAGALIGYVVWHDVPGLHMWVGAAVIIAAGLYVARQAGRVEVKAGYEVL